MGFSFSPLLLSSLYILIIISISSSCFCLIHDTPPKGVDVENPVVDITPTQITGYVSSSRGSKDALLCERVRVSGISRFKLRSYASAYRVTLAPSVDIPEKFHSKIQICFHNNASLGLCGCVKDDWKAIQKGIWFSVMSPYEDRYVDVKFLGEDSGSITVTVEEELQRWRFLCLALGFVLLLLAPIVSSWVPFYYGSSMAIGILLVVIILLFQGMKLLPTGRKNAFYLTIYGSVLGAGSFLVHHLSMFVNSILASFGVSEEMHNPVFVFVLVFIVLAGAALGYWLVRKYVISEDGGVDVGVAQFVKWAMRIIALTFIFQIKQLCLFVFLLVHRMFSTPFEFYMITLTGAVALSSVDTPLAMAAVGCCVAICYLITSFKWRGREYPSYYGNRNIWACSGGGRATGKNSRAEFLSRSAAKAGPRGTLWNGNGPRSSSAFSDSPLKGFSSPSTTSSEWQKNQEVYYSTFHKTPTRKKFSKKEWAEFTDESTRQAVAEWASSPEFTDWVINNADRIKVLDEESDGSIGSSSDSTDENVIDTNNGGGLRLFNW